MRLTPELKKLFRCFSLFETPNLVGPILLGPEAVDGAWQDGVVSIEKKFMHVGIILLFENVRLLYNHDTIMHVGIIFYEESVIGQTIVCMPEVFHYLE